MADITQYDFGAARQLVWDLNTLDWVKGQQATISGASVVISGSVAVTGPLTDTQLRAASVATTLAQGSDVTATGVITTATGSVTIDLSTGAYNSVAIRFPPTTEAAWTGNINIQGTIDGAQWSALTLVDMSAAAVASTVTGSSSAQHYLAATAGLSAIRLVGSAFTGSATITYLRSQRPYVRSVNYTTLVGNGSQAATISVGALRTELQFNGSRMDACANNADNDNVGMNSSSRLYLPVVATLRYHNGTAWDRARGETTYGLDVDPTRVPFATRQDTYTGATSGTAVDASSGPFKYYSIQVKGTGTGAFAWSVVLEGSLDNTTWSTLLTHAATDGSTISTTGPAPMKYFRSRCASVTLGSATNLVTTIVGLN